MKKISIVAAIISALSIIPAGQAANVASPSTVTWQTSAKKTSTASLAVEVANDGEIEFYFDPDTNKFDTTDSIFNVAITGDGSATAFKLVATLGDNTLTHTSGASVSTLKVGMLYNLYDDVTPTAGTSFTLLDSTVQKSVMRDAMRTLINTTTAHPVSKYKLQGKSTASDVFLFNIVSGTSNGVTVPIQNLPNGDWSGSVTVNLVATWTVPA